MADKRISSSNKGFDPISSSSKLGKEAVENIGNGGPPPPTLRSKESEQKILNRQQAAGSSPTQTQTSFIATPPPQISAPVESAEPISNEINFPLIPVFVKFVDNGHIERFDRVSDLNQLRSDIKQRYGIEGEFFLIGAGKKINDTSQLHSAWPGCDGMFHMVVSKKT
jgi:hypothetical protein